MYRFILWNILSLIFSTIRLFDSGDTTRYIFNTPWFAFTSFYCKEDYIKTYHLDYVNS